MQALEYPMSWEMYITYAGNELKNVLGIFHCNKKNISDVCALKLNNLA